MKKLTRQAQTLIFAFLIIIFLIAGFLIIRQSSSEEKVTEPENNDIITLVAENQKIVSTYIDAISEAKSSSTYQPFTIKLEKDMKIGDYALSQEQTFTKYIKPEGPNGTDILTKKSNQAITNYAYSMLLIGDVQEKTNTKTDEKTYEVVNARITYDCIPLVLLSNENSVCLANSKKTDEKIVNLQEFINALKDVEKRESMISW